MSSKTHLSIPNALTINPTVQIKGTYGSGQVKQTSLDPISCREVDLNALTSTNSRRTHPSDKLHLTH
ncbi:hypothetical protein BCR44DRAFT_1438526 [Catenaria anguillulae PL171]|uniref:Uncharacterized protein n=1 Tax=Catenaria anguillulae PL171 TaxID=765915 RepID=A0A1Y2HH42_9FUNG|nr:hypothetical protein BCR44DRAFT_1438526 [Catenaria anguillulae PL171]